MSKRYPWLGDNNSEHMIGGRDTDFEQVAYSLRHEVTSSFGDRAPAALLERIDELADSLQVDSVCLQDLLVEIDEAWNKLAPTTDGDA